MTYESSLLAAERLLGRALNKYGDGPLFGGITKTGPIAVNPDARVGIHTIVPHRHVFAYLTAIKSFLRYHADIAVYVHDDGTLHNHDKELIRAHLPGSKIIDRASADQQFQDRVGDDFLAKVRKSYTSYLKLFDPTWVSTHERIILVDTDVLFLSRPGQVIEWAKDGGVAWYHRSAPWTKKGPKPDRTERTGSASNVANPTHIQHLVVRQIPEINRALDTQLAFVHGFNAGFVGYDNGTVQYSDLKDLLTYLYLVFGDRIFRWGAEQTIHGLILCGAGAAALPLDEYMVYTKLSSKKAERAKFVHFIGEFRYHRLQYPRLAARVIRELDSTR